MLKLTSQELRMKWINYFQKQNHYFLEAVSLIPKNDPSLLFINSGVATIKPYFSGKVSPPSRRLVNCQKVIRTNDIENVGKNSRHNTLFEMLGNFSVGDYFKKEAITMAYQFLTQELKIAPEKLYFTVLTGDQEVYQQWINLGISPDHIFESDKSRNFWDMGLGPCGSCTEIFYDRSTKYDPDNLGLKLLTEDVENDRFIEIWNIVFSEFNNDGSGNYTELVQKNIDTGAGLERLLTISQDVPTNFDTDLFQPIIQAIGQYSENKYDPDNYFTQDKKQTKINEIYRIIADHMRAIVMAISDGCFFSHKGQGSILRKLMRRVIGLSKILGLDQAFLKAGINAVIENLGVFYADLIANQQTIFETISVEFQSFTKTLSTAWKKLKQLFTNSNNQKLDSYQIFKLVETYGFPKELLDEILTRENYHYDHDQFHTYFAAHQSISRKEQTVAAMEQQNQSLIQFTKPSQFNYQDQELTTTIVGLFDQDWNLVDQLDHEDGYVILQETCLYARSGGQEADYGMINNYRVTNVFKSPHQQNVHQVSHAQLAVGQTVIVTHDPVRRQQLQRHHSSVHLLHAALKQLIDPQIKQEGAHKDVDKMSLDFRRNEKLTPEQILALEQFIFDNISAQKPVLIEMVPLEVAKQRGASAYFEDKYQQLTGLLRMVSIGDQSVELCGGTHVANTADIEDFMIISCKLISAGVWRLEGIAGKKTLINFLTSKQADIEQQVNKIKDQLLSFGLTDQTINAWTKKFNFVPNKHQWRENQKHLKAFLTFLSTQERHFQKQQQQTFNQTIRKLALDNPYHFLVHKIELADQKPKMVIEALNNCFHDINNYLFLVIVPTTEKTYYYIAANKTFWLRFKTSANVIAQLISQQFNGRGGGRLEVAQGSFPNVVDQKQLMEVIEQHLCQKQ